MSKPRTHHTTKGKTKPSLESPTHSKRKMQWACMKGFLLAGAKFRIFSIPCILQTPKFIFYILGKYLNLSSLV
jgi:hypothetical protein